MNNLPEKWSKEWKEDYIKDLKDRDIEISAKPYILGELIKFYLFHRKGSEKR